MMVSVVIPLYNKASCIERALRSVLAQTYADFELIVVDDGSSDGGGEVVRRVGDPRIRLVVQENAGVSAARNRGVAEARTELVALLDADDEWAPTFLENALEAMGRFPEAVAVFGNYVRTDTMAAGMALDEAGPPMLVDDLYRFHLNHDTVMCASCVLVRRTAMLQASGFPVGRKVGEDLDSWFRLACVGKAVVLPEILATYHTGVGICTTAVGNMDVWDTYQSWLQAGRIPESLRSSARALAVRWRLNTVLFLLRKGRRSEAKSLLGVLRWSELWTPMGFTSMLACRVPLMPHALRWGIVRFAQKYIACPPRQRESSAARRPR